MQNLDKANHHIKTSEQELKKVSKDIAQKLKEQDEYAEEINAIPSYLSTYESIQKDTISKMKEHLQLSKQATELVRKGRVPSKESLNPIRNSLISIKVKLEKEKSEIQGKSFLLNKQLERDLEKISLCKKYRRF